MHNRPGHLADFIYELGRICTQPKALVDSLIADKVIT
jgi:hypothetical protein